MIDELVHVALHRSVAAGRVRIEPTARPDSEVCRFLHRLHREISGRVDDDRPLATDPGDNGGPVFIIMAATGLAFLPTATHATPQRLLATAWRLPLVASGVIEFIRFHGALQLPLHLVGQGGMAQPPTPALARPHIPPQFS